MEWSDLTSTISKYAPLVATTLSSPLGAAIGAGTIIANLFGVEAKPESVMDYINKNPVKAQEKISVFEMIKEQNRHEENIKSIEFQNIDGARKNSENVNISPVDNKIKMILVVGQFTVLTTLIALFFFFKESMNQSVTITLGSVMGVIMANIASMINYYWGTSFSSQKKDDVIAGKK